MAKIAGRNRIRKFRETLRKEYSYWSSREPMKNLVASVPHQDAAWLDRDLKDGLTFIRGDKHFFGDVGPYYFQQVVKRLGEITHFDFAAFNVKPRHFLLRLRFMLPAVLAPGNGAHSTFAAKRDELKQFIAGVQGLAAERMQDLQGFVRRALTEEAKVNWLYPGRVHADKVRVEIKRAFDLLSTGKMLMTNESVRELQCEAESLYRALFLQLNTIVLLNGATDASIQHIFETLTHFGYLADNFLQLFPDHAPTQSLRACVDTLERITKEAESNLEVIRFYRKLPGDRMERLQLITNMLETGITKDEKTGKTDWDRFFPSVLAEVRLTPDTQQSTYADLTQDVSVSTSPGPVSYFGKNISQTNKRKSEDHMVENVMKSRLPNAEAFVRLTRVANARFHRKGWDPLPTDYPGTVLGNNRKGHDITTTKPGEDLRSQRKRQRTR